MNNEKSLSKQPYYPSMKSALRSSGFAVLLLVSLVTAHSQTVTHLFRGGENDAGATNGGALAGTTIDAVGSTNLTKSGTGGTYTSNTPGPGSSLAFNFNGSQNYIGALDTSLTTNSSFAMEAWINANQLSSTVGLFYNGHTGSQGVGLFLVNNRLAALRGGIGFTASTTDLSTGVWTHVALVVDSGNLSVYLNGNNEISVVSSFINPTNGGLAIGGNPSGGELFSGAIDHARIFTFGTGTFNTSMLSFPASAIPEPSTYVTIFGSLALAFAVYRRRRIAA